MTDLLAYCLRITPGLVLVMAIVLLLPRGQVMARIFTLILGFILMRDAMTPAGFWSFGITPPAVWLRFTTDSLVLLFLGVASLLVAGLVLQFKELRSLVRWGSHRSPTVWAAGLGAGLLVAAPFVLVSLGVPLDDRGGQVAATLLPALAFMSLAGNFLEELLFRGLLQGRLEESMSSVRAAVLSGLLFAAAHVFLATTVTDLGWPVLLFVLFEGLACAFVHRRFGLISASLTHATAIFVLAAGLI